MCSSEYIAVADRWYFHSFHTPKGNKDAQSKTQHWGFSEIFPWRANSCPRSKVTERNFAFGSVSNIKASTSATSDGFLLRQMPVSKYFER